MRTSAVSSGGVAAFESAREGMKGAERRLERAADRISKGDLSPDRVVDLIVSQGTYSANAKVVKTQDEMVGALLNVTR